MELHVICTVTDPDRIRSQTLFAETVRVGFPDAKITVYVNPTEVVGWHSRFDTIACEVVYLREPAHHADWIAQVVREAQEKTVIIDPDTIWWRSCQWFHFPVWAGYHVPAMWNEWAQCPSCARIHTSFLWIENPEKLRSAIKKALPMNQARRNEYVNFNPFHPFVSFADGMPVFYDTCANLFQAIGADVFGPEHLACYDHLNSASFYDEMLERVDRPEEFRKLHQIAESCPEKLKGLHLEIQRYYERCARKLLDYVK